MHGFISYSHEDKRLFDEFRKHLKAIERECKIEFWADDRIATGYDWTASIADAIARADVCILLTSAEFIASDYIYNKEIPAIQARRKAGALIVPVILRRCAWQMIVGVLQAVPTIDGRVKPIENWKRRNDAFDHAREQISVAIKNRFALSSSAVFGSTP